MPGLLPEPALAPEAPKLFLGLSGDFFLGCGCALLTLAVGRVAYDVVRVINFLHRAADRAGQRQHRIAGSPLRLL